MQGTKLRSYYKRALRGFLPEQVLTKTKHGFGLPFGVWMKTDPELQAFFYSLMTSLKTRRVFEPNFIDEVVEQHRSGPAAYFGYFIWDLAVLEHWLSVHSRPSMGSPPAL
jgi:asparagine synthase (glutamine-hydrolysing)